MRFTLMHGWRTLIFDFTDMRQLICIRTGTSSFTTFYIRVYNTTLISERIKSGEAVHIEITGFFF